MDVGIYILSCGGPEEVLCCSLLLREYSAVQYGLSVGIRKGFSGTDEVV
jgi:hypothetical protein